MFGSAQKARKRVRGIHRFFDGADTEQFEAESAVEEANSLAGTGKYNYLFIIEIYIYYINIYIVIIHTQNLPLIFIFFVCLSFYYFFVVSLYHYAYYYIMQKILYNNT